MLSESSGSNNNASEIPSSVFSETDPDQTPTEDLEESVRLAANVAEAIRSGNLEVLANLVEDLELYKKGIRKEDEGAKFSSSDAAAAIRAVAKERSGDDIEALYRALLRVPDDNDFHLQPHVAKIVGVDDMETLRFRVKEKIKAKQQ